MGSALIVARASEALGPAVAISASMSSFPSGPVSRNISTRAQKHADISAKSLHRDLCIGGFLECIVNEVVFIGEEAPWRKSCGKRQTPRGEKPSA